MQNSLSRDLDHILAHTEGLWEEIRGKRIFITGGTGFFGCWLLESFLWANDRLNLNAAATVLTRDPDAFQEKVPHLASHPAVELHKGDIRTFDFPGKSYSHIIHAATEASARLNYEDPLFMFEVIVAGTRRVLEFVTHCGAEKLLFTSSGAVYGKQSPHITHLPEDYNGGPDTMDTLSVYGEAKRAAELLCAICSAEYGIETKIARCFAFVGPYMPMNAHFAVGNFILHALRGGPITVHGDGSPYRSYLYAADLAIWLWTILFRGKSCRPYNVGSENDITIADLARTVAARTERVDVVIGQSLVPGKPAQRYVPFTKRALLELNLKQWIDLPEAISRTAKWNAQL